MSKIINTDKKIIEIDGNQYTYDPMNICRHCGKVYDEKKCVLINQCSTCYQRIRMLDPVKKAQRYKKQKEWYEKNREKIALKQWHYRQKRKFESQK